MPHGHHHTHDSLIRWPRLYDLTIALLGHRGPRLRAGFLEDLRLAAGDRVLDVGSGTGLLALAVAERVAPTGSVDGVDAARQMVARASAKAQRRRLPAWFWVGYAQRLPFPDSTFDAVMCTLALHHVAEADRETAVHEMYRVLRPGGRLLIAEFQPSANRGWRRHSLGGRHGHDDNMIEQARALCSTAGFTELTQSRTNLQWLGKLTGIKPTPEI